jgi:hypothetical protein
VATEHAENAGTRKRRTSLSVRHPPIDRLENKIRPCNDITGGVLVRMFVGDEAPLAFGFGEMVEIAYQDFGRVAEIEQILGFATGLRGFEMQRQSPLAGKGRALVPRDMADMLESGGGSGFDQGAVQYPLERLGL